MAKLSGANLKRSMPVGRDEPDEDDFDESPANSFLNDRLEGRMSPGMADYTMGRRGGGDPRAGYESQVPYGRRDKQDRMDPSLGADTPRGRPGGIEDMLLQTARQLGIKIDPQGKWLDILGKVSPTDDVLEGIQQLTGKPPNVNGQ